MKYNKKWLSIRKLLTSNYKLNKGLTKETGVPFGNYRTVIADPLIIHKCKDENMWGEKPFLVLGTKMPAKAFSNYETALKYMLEQLED